jgi:hypothetical protein
MTEKYDEVVNHHSRSAATISAGRRYGLPRRGASCV